MLMMLPFEAPTIFEGIHKSYFRMPRVVRDQRSRFENDDLFRQLSHESAVKYIGFKERPLAERQNQFITDCYLGHTEISVVQSGNQFTLMFTPTANPAYDHEGCYIDKEQGKAHIKAGFILNGVCVLWRGWIDLQRLEGFGCLEFDEYRAYLEDAMAKQQADGKQQQQQLCNSAGLQAPPPQLGGRLSYAPSGPPAPGPPGGPLSAINNSAAAAAAVAAAAATTNSMLPPVGLNSSCLTAAAGADPSALPPVSLADSAAAATHYGNAAIAAAAAAAFHQALTVPGASLNNLHGLGVPTGPPQAVPPPHSLVNHQHLAAAYTQASQQLHHPNSSPTSQLHLNGRGKSPPDHQQRSEQNLSSQNNKNNNNNAPNTQNAPATKRAPSKRAHEEASQTNEEVDVVSDISAHELDLPPRRIFKSEPIASHHHHHHHHHSQHKISRRAA